MRSSWLEQLCGHDDLVSVENSHQLGDRQFGVAIIGVEIGGQFGLCAAHRLHNRNKFFLHRDYSTLLRTPRLTGNARRRFRFQDNVLVNRDNLTLPPRRLPQTPASSRRRKKAA